MQDVIENHLEDLLGFARNMLEKQHIKILKKLKKYIDFGN